MHHSRASVSSHQVGAPRVRLLEFLLVGTPTLVALSPLVPGLLPGSLPFPIYAPFVLGLIVLLSSRRIVAHHDGPGHVAASALGWAGVVTTLLGAGALAWAPSLGDATRELSAVGISLWAAWALARAIPASGRILKWSLTGWAIAWAVVLAGAVTEFVLGTPLLTTTQSYLAYSHHLGSAASYTYVASFLGNPNDLAGFLLTVTPLVLALAVHQSRKRMFAAVLVAFAIACVWTGSRTALGALIPFAMVMFLCRPRTSAKTSRRRLAAIGATLGATALIVAGLALSPFAQAVVQRLFAPFRDDVASQDQARAGWSTWAWDQAVQHHVILGAGPGSFESYASSTGFPTNLHDSLLEIGFQYGLLAMASVVASLVLVFAVGARAAVAHSPGSYRAIGALAALSVVGLVLWSFTSSSILMNGFWGLALGGAAGIGVFAFAHRSSIVVAGEPGATFGPHEPGARVVSNLKSRPR